MKSKVRFRISGLTEGKGPRKFAIHLGSDAPVTLGAAIPELKRSVAQLTVRGGNLYADDRKGRELEVNGVSGKEFRLKPGDVLKSGEISVEFLEVPEAPEEAPDSTRVVDVSNLPTADDGTRIERLAQPVELDPANSMIDEGGPAPYEPTRVTSMSQSGSRQVTRTVSNSSAREDSYGRSETRDQERERTRLAKSMPKRAEAAARSGGDTDGPSKLMRKMRSSEITSMLARKPRDATLQQRHGLFTTLALIFLSSALTAGASKLGFALTWGFFGVGIATAIAGGLQWANALTGARGTFGDYLKSLAVWSFGFVVWGYAYRFAPVAAIAVAVVIGGLFVWAFSNMFKPKVSGLIAVGGSIAILPAIASFVLYWNLARPVSESSSQATASNSSENEQAEVANRQPASEAPPVAAVAPVTSLPVTAMAPATAPIAPAAAPVAPTAPNAMAPSYQAFQAHPVAQANHQAYQAPVEAPKPAEAKPLASAPEIVPDLLATEQFFSAVKSGNLEVVRSLVQRRAVDPNFTLDRGNTALMYAAANGHLNIVKFLISQRVAIDARDPNGTTALMWAVYKGRAEVAKFLVSKGANLDLHRDDGDTALSIAKRWKRWDIAEVLQRAASSKSGDRMPASNTRSRHGYGRRGR